MNITMLKSKLHRARVTEADPDYEGSCAIDRALMEAAGILPFEQVHVYNIRNGERFTTYAIAAPEGSGTVGMYGAAARRAAVGDVVILCTYASVPAEEAAAFEPVLVHLDEGNRIRPARRGLLAA